MYVIYAACTFLNDLIKGGDTKQKDFARQIKNDIEEIYEEMQVLKEKLESSQFDDSETEEHEDLKDMELDTDSKC